MKRLSFFSLLLLLPALPASAMVVRQPHACPMIAMQCPDGTYVSPTGPNCEMAPCPGGGQPGQPKPAPIPVPPAGDGISGSTGSGTAEPGVITGTPVQPVPDALPDLPLEPPKDPQTVKFLVEHRSAIDGQHVTVHGIIVAVPTGDRPCHNHKGPCTPSHLILADTADASRNKAYDINVELPANDPTPYAQGEIVDIAGTVSVNDEGVSVQKE